MAKTSGSQHSVFGDQYSIKNITVTPVLATLKGLLATHCLRNVVLD